MRRDHMAAHRRHDISDKVWANIEKLLPGSKGSVGRPSADNRLFINAVFWILRTGAPWRDLPPDLGDWKNTHRRFCRWRDRGVWEKILEALIVEPDFEWLIIDASHCKVHPHAAGAAGGNEAMSRSKGGSTQKYTWPWMRMVCRSELLLQKVPELIAKRPVRWLTGWVPGHFWLIEATIRRVFSAKQVNPVSRLSSRQREVVKYHATMTESSTKSGILSRMLFSISSAGGELPHDMPKDVHLFLPPFKSDAYLCGQT